MHAFDDFFDTLALYGHIQHVLFAAMVVAGVLLAAYFVFD